MNQIKPRKMSNRWSDSLYALSMKAKQDGRVVLGSLLTVLLMADHLQTSDEELLLHLEGEIKRQRDNL